ncbi:MAG: diguanylate cyclase [Nitrospirae bacterium]|nr:diguanylate cyclase [Nitrospirota bacterium]
MTLRKKTLIIILISLICAISIFYISARIFLLGSFKKLEDKDTKKHIQIALRSIAHSLEVIDSKTGDWANWDDTYAFIQNRNPEYIKTNPSDKTFSELEINVMLFINSSGNIVYSKAFDLLNGKEISMPQSLLAHLSENRLLLMHDNIQSKHTGIILLTEGPMLIASRPILTSEGKGPVRGALIFGRFLDDEEIQRIIKDIQFPIAFIRFDSVDMPTDFKSAKSLLSEEKPVVTIPINDKKISGYTILKDIYGNPALMLRADLERDIFQHGTKTIFSFIFLLILIGLFLGLIIILFLNKLVLNRILALSKNVRNIAIKRDLTMRIPVEGGDELSTFSEEMNRMLEELNRADMLLRESEEKFRDIFKNANDMIQIVDAEGRFLDVNRKWCETLGYTKEEAMQMRFTDIVRKDQIPHCIETFKRVVNGESIEHMETVYISKDGREIYVEGSINPSFKGNKFSICRGIMRDITIRKQMEKRLEHLAVTDTLTNTYNRTKFDEVIKKEISRVKRYSHPLSLIMFDVDHFKRINDTHGHIYGDYVLKTLTNIVKENMRETDYLIRWGGEEFIILSPNTDLNNAKVLSERIRKAVEEYSFEKNQKVTVSFGVTEFRQYDIEDTFVKRADDALYKAKEAGRNRVEVSI